MSLAARTLDARYKNSFGYIAGYLPRSRDAVDAWFRSLKAQLARAREEGRTATQSPAVAALAKLIETDGIVRM